MNATENATVLIDGLRERGYRGELVPMTGRPDQVGVNVWLDATRRYPADTVWFVEGGSAVWGPSFEFWAKADSENLAEQVVDTL